MKLAPQVNLHDCHVLFLRICQFYRTIDRLYIHCSLGFCEVD